MRTISQMPPTMVRYNVTRNDMLRSQIRGLVTKRSLWALWAICSALVIWTNFNSPDLGGKPLAVKIVATALILLLVAAGGAVGGLFTLLVGLAKKNRGVLGEHTIELTEQGLIEKTEVNESVHRWAGVHKVFRTANYIYIYVTETNYHVIPLRAFESPGHADAFETELRQRTATAKGNVQVAG